MTPTGPDATGPTDPADLTRRADPADPAGLTRPAELADLAGLAGPADPAGPAELCGLVGMRSDNSRFAEVGPLA